MKSFFLSRALFIFIVYFISFCDTNAKSCIEIIWKMNSQAPIFSQEEALRLQAELLNSDIRTTRIEKIKKIFPVVIETNRLWIVSLRPFGMGNSWFFPILKETREAVGKIDLVSFDRHMNLPIYFHPSVHNHGLALEAKYALLRYAFEILESNDSEAYIDSHNQPSIQLHRHLGYRPSWLSSSYFRLKPKTFNSKRSEIEEHLKQKILLSGALRH